MGADFLYAICEISADRDVAEKRIKSMAIEEIARAWGEEDCVDDSRDLVKEAIECLDVVYGNQRDTGTLRLDDTEYVLTGGMSWGDAPTDAYDAIGKIAMLGVTGEFWEGNHP